MKQSKAQKILAYAKKNPDASMSVVAKALKTNYSYVYKTLRGTKADTTLAKEVSIIPSHAVSDGSTADYYQLPSDAKELQDLISHKDMNAQIGEIFRSCYRYGEVAHSKKLRDAKKIKYYAEAEIKRLEKLGEG